MIELLANTNNTTQLIVPVLLLLAVIAVCATVFAVLTWNVEPWTRKYLKPHKQLRMDRYRVKIHRLRMRNPEAFAVPSPFREQEINMDHVVDEAVKVVTAVEHPSA